MCVSGCVPCTGHNCPLFFLSKRKPQEIHCSALPFWGTRFRWLVIYYPRTRRFIIVGLQVQARATRVEAPRSSESGLSPPSAASRPPRPPQWAAPLAKEGSHRLLRPECACLGLTVERARRQRARRDRRVVEPGWSKAAESATFGGGALEHPRQWLGAQWPGFSRWECCTAESRQARPEEAQQPKPGTAEGYILAMLPSKSVTQAWSEACGGV